MPELQPERFLDFNHFLDGNPGPPSTIYLFYGLFFLMVLGFGLYVYFGVRPQVTHKLRRYYAERLAIIDIVLGGVGILLIVIRVVGIPILSARILTYFWLVITVIYLFFVAYFLNTILPQRIRQYEASFARLQYQARPRPNKGSSAKSPKRRKNR